MWLLKAVGVSVLYAVASTVLKALLPSSWTRPDRARRFAIGFFLLFASVLWVVAADIMFSSDHAGAATARDATYTGIFFIVVGFAMVGFAFAAAANKQGGPR